MPLLTTNYPTLAIILPRSIILSLISLSTKVSFSSPSSAIVITYRKGDGLIIIKLTILSSFSSSLLSRVDVSFYSLACIIILTFFYSSSFTFSSIRRSYMFIEGLSSSRRLIFFLFDELGPGNGKEDMFVGLETDFYFITFRVTKASSTRASS